MFWLPIYYSKRSKKKGASSINKTFAPCLGGITHPAIIIPSIPERKTQSYGDCSTMIHPNSIDDDSISSSVRLPGLEM